MTQYNKINIKLSTSQLNKLKSAIKNETEVIIRISPNMIGNSNDRLIFCMNYYQQTGTFLVFVRHSQIIHQLILNFQRHKYQKWYNQEDF